MSDVAVPLLALVAAFAIYVAVYLALKDRPIALYDDEIVNHSGVTSFRNPASCPYMFGFFPIMHALHRSLMARVPREQEVAAGRLVNIASILVHCLGMVLLLAHVYAPAVAIAAAAWWMLSGWGLGFHVGRLNNYTERAFGDLLVFIGFAAFVLLAEARPWLAGATAAVLWAPVWHSSKFGIQAILLVGLVGSLVLASPVLALAVAASALVSVAVFGTVVVRQAADQLGHLDWSWRRGMSYLTHLDGPRETTRQKLVALIQRQKIFSHFFIYLPTLPLVVVALLWLGAAPANTGEALAVACLVVSGLTLIGKAVIIGPSARYAYILLPFLLARLLTDWPAAGWTLGVLEAGFGVVVGLAYFQRIRARDTARDSERLAGLRRLLATAGAQGPTRIVCDPLRLAEMIQSVDPPARLAFASYGFTRENVEFVVEHYPVLPHLEIDAAGVGDLIRRYGFDGALIDLQRSRPAIRAAFEANGFAAMGEDGGFVLLWRRGAGQRP